MRLTSAGVLFLGGALCLGAGPKSISVGGAKKTFTVVRVVVSPDLSNRPSVYEAIEDGAPNARPVMIKIVPDDSVARDSELLGAIAINKVLDNAEKKGGQGARSVYLLDPLEIAPLDVADGTPEGVALIMEKGEATLKDVIQAKRFLLSDAKATDLGSRIDELAILMYQTRRALSEIHANGMVYRDFKPANVVLSIRRDMARPTIRNGGIAAVVIDYSTVRGLDSARASNVAAGTGRYIPPEALHPNGSGSNSLIDYSSDFYSWAVSFYEMAFGRDYAGEDMAAAFKHLRDALILPRFSEGSIDADQMARFDQISYLLSGFSQKTPGERKKYFSRARRPTVLLSADNDVKAMSLIPLDWIAAISEPYRPYLFLSKEAVENAHAHLGTQRLCEIRELVEAFLKQSH